MTHIRDAYTSRILRCMCDIIIYAILYDIAYIVM